jgi:uncharacterized protein
MKRHTGLIVKCTRLCNLRCTYCHDWKTGPDQTMPFPVLAHMTSQVLRDPENDSVSFLWHGGEPLLLPRDFFTKALYLQGHLRRDGQHVTNAIQTNGTLVDDAWARFIREHGIGVSLSLDGPPDLHDRHRVYASGRPSFRDVVRGMRVLREHEVPFSVLMVVDEAALMVGADRIFDVFLELGVTSFGLLGATPINVPEARPRTPTAHYIEPARMTEFLVRMYDRWREHGDRRIRIRELEAIRQRVAGVGAGLCTLAGDCFGRYYAIEPNGDIAHCDVFVGDPAYTLGNVLCDRFAELREGAAMRALRDENEAALQAMKSCPDFALCNGACPHERYLAMRHDAAYQPECCGWRTLFEHVRAAESTLAAPRTGDVGG